LPTDWDGPSGKGVRWKTEVPGLAHSSPVIWGNKLFVTTAISKKDRAGIRTGLYGDVDPVDDRSSHRFEVWCLDRRTGELLWKRLAYEGTPKVKRHTKSTHANPTPAVDGKHVVVSFGSEGLFAFDLDGELLWKRDLGVLDAGFFRAPEAQWGYASSPVIHDGRVIVLADVQKSSFLAAFDVETGKEIWRTPRSDVPTWGTPTVHDDGSRTQVIVNGFRHIGGYDFRNGKELWRMSGTGDIPIPTPYVADGLIYLTSAHGPGSPIYAIRTDASGTLELNKSGTHPSVPWSHPRGGSYMPTTIVYRGLLYVCRDNGGLTVFDAKSGKRVYQQRLGSGSAGFVASAIAGDGKVYFTDEDGVTYVVKAGNTFEQLAENDIGGVALATPAIADGTIYVRTVGHVVAVDGAPDPD
jgi:outer membrane protein assembly factor BamB